MTKQPFSYKDKRGGTVLSFDHMLTMPHAIDLMSEDVDKIDVAVVELFLV